MALGPGSIAFVGFNADGDDNLAFVALEPIVAGTVIYFQDNEWNGSAIGAGGAFNSGESAWHWTANAAIAAGTVVTIDNIGSGTITSNHGAVAFDDDGNRGLSNGGDTVYAYVGSSSAPTAFLTAVTSGSFASDGSIANTGLAAEVNALQFGGERDIFTFNGARSGEASFADYAAIINTSSNWIFQDGGGDQSNDAIAPDVPFSLDTFSVSNAVPTLASIAPVTATIAEGNSGTTDFDFTVTLSAPAVVDTVIDLFFTGDASDFAAIPTSVTVLAGQASAIATFVVTGDTAVEANENFTVTASLDGVDKQAVATIQNDDGSSSVTDIDLSLYVRVGRFDLPEPTRTSAPAGNLLAQEASGVTYNWDTDTLFIVGDGGRSVTEVSKTGQLISTMTLAAGNSPQGTDFYDPEGVTYIGNGEFVFTEERDRQVVKFTYEADTTLHRADTQTVDLGTFVDNTGLEGLSYDPLTGGYILVKEISPEGIFQTNIDFGASTASNGSPTTQNSINLFDPALTGLSDFADVFALSNLPSLDGLPQSTNLLVLSQQDGRIVAVDREGNILSSLQIVADPGSPLSVADQQHEGITMDRDGNIYIVNENGGGDIDHPQLWVYAKSTVPNEAPSAVVLNNAVTSIVENTATPARVRMADISVVDDGLGNNMLTLTGADAGFFEIAGGSLFLKAGTILDYETKTSYSVTVNVDDPTLGSNPDATVDFTLSVTDLVNETPVLPSVFISEIHPSGSGNGSYSADWFEVTNAGAGALDITGWQMDDNSNGTGKVALRGVTSIASGQSAIFLEGTADGSTDAALIAAFSTAWFGSATLPAGVVVGVYGGSGVGLSTGGDAVNLFDAAGNRVTGVSFGAATDGVSFDNHAGLGSDALPLPTVSTLSTAGSDGAFHSANGTETGSPGAIGAPVEVDVRITEVAPWSSGDSPVGADWFEVTNFGTTAVDLSGWRMDDNSQSFVGAVALNGVSSIAPGESVIFIESSSSSAIASFLATWFGGNVPAGLQIGLYSGSGVGLSTGGDAVNLYDSTGALQASVNFGESDSTAPYSTFDNAAGLDNASISQLSATGTNGGFVAANDANEIGSPGSIETVAAVDVRVTEVAPWSSGDSPVGADWFELTNFGTTAVDLTGWRMDDDSHSFGSAVTLNGITSLGAGESVIFIESNSPSTAIANFLNTWFGGNAPAGLHIGTYSGSGVGLSTGGDQVNIYDSAGTLQANVNFGASDSTAPFSTFDNAAGLNNATISQLSAVGVNGGAVAANDSNEIGSPGSIETVAEVDVRVTEVAPWSSGNSPVGADWFELTNFGTTAVDLTGWRMDDDSHSFGSAVALHGITSLAPGESVIFIESNSPANASTNFLNTWFGGNAPAGLQIGTYSGSGVGLSTGGDAVNIYDSTGALQASVSFGASDSSAPYSTFDNTDGLNNATITQLAAAGIHGAFMSEGNNNEIGSPGQFNDTIINFDAITDGVNTGEGSDTLINHGSITSPEAPAIDLGAGNDTFLLGATGSVTGDILLGAGSDTATIMGTATSIAGGSGDDFYYIANSNVAIIENAGEGFDRVFAYTDYTLTAGSEVEWLQAGFDSGQTLTGNELDNMLIGADGADTLIGGAGNDQLGGFGGADILIGGEGDDIYYVDSSDTVTELVGQGFDKVFAATDFTLADGSEIEWLQADAGSTGLTLTGNELDNSIAGGDGDDTLNGGAGNDTLNGLGGTDTLNGGDGDDTYYVDGADTVTELVGQGFDKVFATTDYTLAAGSEVEWLQAAAGNTGVTLTGNEFANAVLGGAGADTLDGGAGADQLYGDAGADSFVFKFGEANGDTVVDFTASAGDHLDFFGYGEGATLTQAGSTNSWTITADAAHGSVTETITLTSVFSLNAQDYLFH